MGNKSKSNGRRINQTADGRMAQFDEQTAKDLEFDVVKSLLLNHCHNPTTVERANSLHPRVNPKAWRRELERTKEFLNLRSEGVPFPAVGGEEIASDNERLAVRDSVLDESGFNRIRTATETVNAVIEALEDKSHGFPRLHHLIENLVPTRNYQKPSIRLRCKGRSSKQCLAQIDSNPEEKVRLRRSLNRQFLKELKKNQERGWLADTKEGFINQRRVLAVNSTHKRKVSGLPWANQKTPPSPSLNPHLRYR